MTITEDEQFTTIQVRVETRELLKKLGRKGETYNEIISALARAEIERRKRANEFTLTD
jgi:predicted RNA-binding protein YlqC (UPF0109 family)